MTAINNHSLSRNYNFKNRNTKVYLSREPDGRVMVFVHGFNGHPVKTWGTFPGYLTSMPDFSGIDLIFYNYDSMSTQANNSAIHLAELMNALMNYPNQLIEKTGGFLSGSYERRSKAFVYNKMYLVAHSLGAVVSRLAIIRANKSGVKWPEITELILFAPAHMGARVGAISSIVKLFFPGPLRLIPAIIFFKIVTIDDVNLDLQNCVLHGLQKDTEKLQKNITHKFTIARLVLYAEKENIVSNTDFLKDPPAHLVDLADHVSICKPSLSNYDGVRQLEKVVQR